jgi:hypothetical protein
MTSAVLAVLFAIAVIACPISSLNAQPEEQTRQWRLGKAVDGQLTLVFGTGSGEDMTIAFHCTPRGGVIGVFVAATTEALELNRPITATLSAGSARSSMPGKTILNEDAGAPSFEGTLSTTDPLLDAMAKAKNLFISVGGWRTQVPLQGIGNKSRQLATLCRGAAHHHRRTGLPRFS